MDQASNAPAASERSLPHHPELERTILAALLSGTQATAMHKVRQTVIHPLGFYLRNHRIVYLACLDLDDTGERIDVAAVGEWLSRMDFRVALDRLRHQERLLEAQGNLDRNQMRKLYRWREEDRAAGHADSALAAIGDYAFLSDLCGVFAPSVSLERNARLLWDLFCKRRYIQMLAAMAEQAYRTTDDFDALIGHGSQVLLELAGQAGGGSVKAAGQVVDETLDRIGEAMNQPDSGVKTGWADLDDKLMALRPGGLYILAARPGVGKTSFALNLVEQLVAKEEDGVLFFSLEVDAVDLLKKLISSYAKVPFRKLELGNLSDEEMETVTDAAQVIRNWPLDIMDICDLTIAQLRSQVKRLQLERQGRLKMVVIDYLQLLNPSRSDMSEYEKVSEISRTLKTLAKECRLPVVALSQLSRESDRGAQPGPPRLSHLRGSGSIEQDADAVVFLHHEEGNDPDDLQRRMQVIIAKNRFGPQGMVPMWFYAARQRFVQTAQEEAPQEGPVTSAVEVIQRGGGSDEDHFA